MEEQIQRYCLNPIKKFLFKLLILFLLIFLFYLFYFIYFKNFKHEKNLIIPKGSSFTEISFIVLKNNNYIENKFYTLYLKFWNRYVNKIDYGEFKLMNNLSLNKITQIISNPSNVFYKLTIVEGWQQFQLDKLFIDNFGKIIDVQYNEIVADTFLYNSNDELEKIITLMKKNKENFFLNHKNNLIFKRFSIDEILIISSLVEKEGINIDDKRLISSVIFNRLKNNMKLQIDASTIYSITKGKQKLNRKLKIKDLKIIDDFNTYHIYGLPPKPICYVGPSTIEIVLENFESDYFFYFFNKNLNKHIFSKTFQEHKNKLKDYRNKNEK